ncbi:TRAP dicarboxylate transporter, DctQ subunit, unknown substrate 3 [Candidatus Rhodobacter oscarellae]|uniref:TRAP transporter small permease protein n=1 Tax=Candidatus Rhodobacter oscarellae TaxID=1675527 RepID=A0A0J9H1M9_9RHOB|nr:TRAP dicarboxylate transporter, DctQ subunit, unknown substrate 3 [Candidatus Rhodobacter lobularis]
MTWAVFARYVLNDPILGDTELVKMGMALVVMMAMPYAAWQGAHIRVDILDGKLGERGRFVADVFARVVSIFVLYLLITKTYDKAWDAWEYEDVTNMIEIPVWVPYTAITVGMGLFGLVLLWQLVAQFRRGVRGYE